MVKTAQQLDVDTRFLLANDRTLLAWIRTSLAIEAGGLVLIQIHPDEKWLGVSVAAFGAAVALIGYSRYRDADKAIRSGRLPSAGIGPVLEVGMVVALAVCLSIAQITLN